MDLFKVPDDYYLAHCISADAEMGKGIAVEFDKRFALSRTRTDGALGWLKIGDCFEEGKVFSLVTKQRYYDKPTYDTLTMALMNLLAICVELNIKYLAMPKIGCGLDRLSWPKVREIILELFNEIDINILICVKD
jgi:O-acetyl-ADP-ribose deacetylase (regulator of RNase III)